MGGLWHQKTRLPGLLCGVVCVILRLAVLVECRLVTDRQIDTDRHRHRPMASTAHAQPTVDRQSQVTDRTQTLKQFTAFESQNLDGLHTQKKKKQ